MPSRIQEWVAEQWFNKQPGGTPITAERLNRIEQQVQGVTQDLNVVDATVPDLATKVELNAAIAGIDINDPDFDAFLAALDPNIRDVVNGTNGTLTKDAIIALIVANSSSVFRGAWSSLSEVASYDFESDIPSVFTMAGRYERIANPGDAGAPPQATVLKISYNNNIFDPYIGSAQMTVPAGVTAVRFIWEWTSSNSSGLARFLINGSSVKQSADGQSMPWTVDQFVVSPGDVLTWDTTAMFATSNPILLGYVKLLTSVDPYAEGDIVVHNGKLYRNELASNVAEPGTNSSWTAILDPIPTTTDIKSIVKITQAAYDALATKVATTLYVIVG